MSSTAVMPVADILPSMESTTRTSEEKKMDEKAVEPTLERKLERQTDKSQNEITDSPRGNEFERNFEERRESEMQDKSSFSKLMGKMKKHIINWRKGTEKEGTFKAHGRKEIVSQTNENNRQTEVSH